MFFFLLLFSAECQCGCVDNSNADHIKNCTTGTNSESGEGSKTAHTKVATVGGHGTTQAPNKRSSSGAEGDYQLVQHEVLFSTGSQYEVSSFLFLIFFFVL